MTRPRVPSARPHIPVTLAWGVALAAITALISGVSIFVNGFAVKQLPDAAVYTTLKNGVAAVLLIGLAIAVVPRAQVRAIDRRSWTKMAVIGVIGGSVPFLLFFSGLAIASAPTAAFIHKTLFICRQRRSSFDTPEKLRQVARTANINVTFGKPECLHPAAAVHDHRGRGIVCPQHLQSPCALCRRFLTDTRVNINVQGADRRDCAFVGLNLNLTENHVHGKVDVLLALPRLNPTAHLP